MSEMVNRLAMRMQARGAELEAQHTNDYIAPGVPHPATEDAALLLAGAREVEKQTRERLAYLDKFVNPPIMVVPTEPEDVRDAKRWREFVAQPWWKRLARALA